MDLAFISSPEIKVFMAFKSILSTERLSVCKHFIFFYFAVIFAFIKIFFFFKGMLSKKTDWEKGALNCLTVLIFGTTIF